MAERNGPKGLEGSYSPKGDQVVRDFLVSRYLEEVRSVGDVTSRIIVSDFQRQGVNIPRIGLTVQERCEVSPGVYQVGLDCGGTLRYDSNTSNAQSPFMDCPVHLTKAEGAVLLVLMLCAPRDISRQNLYSELYSGQRLYPNEEILKTYVSRVRKKIDRKIDDSSKGEWEVIKSRIGGGWRIAGAPSAQP